MRRTTRNGVFAVVAVSGAMAAALPVSAAFADDGAGARGAAAGSPGPVSGNIVRLPVDVPVNVRGNTVNVVGLLNPAATPTRTRRPGRGRGRPRPAERPRGARPPARPV